MEVTKTGVISGFVALEQPSTKFNTDGTYSCQLDFTGEDAKTMKAMVDGYMAKSLSDGAARGVTRAANPPYTIKDKVLTVKFKQNAVIRSKAGKTYELDVKIYDAKGKLVEEQLMIGSGTSCKVAFKPYCWAVASLGCGCTLQLGMVQIIDLVKRGSDSDSNPFGVEEGFETAKKDVNPFEEVNPLGDTVSIVETMDDDSGDF